jgi:hypothetical protein
LECAQKYSDADQTARRNGCLAWAGCAVLEIGGISTDERTEGKDGKDNAMRIVLTNKMFFESFLKG